MHESKERDWRGINVRRNRKYEHILERLCIRKETALGKPIFEFNKDLMVFAAMVGHTLGKKEPVEDNSIQIVLGTYASDEKDGYIYLLSLLENQDISQLKDEALSDSITVFEEYCNGGLSVIDQWLSEYPQDLDGTETLVTKILEELTKLTEDDDVVTVEPTF